MVNLGEIKFKQQIYSTLEEINKVSRVIGEVNYVQLDDLYRRAYRENILHLVTPDRIIKLNCKIDGLRLVENSQLRDLWESELFVDPLLRKFRLLPIDTVNVNIIPNEYCCLNYPEMGEIMDLNRMVKNSNNDESIKYKDHRFVAGVKAPARNFSIMDMRYESERICKREWYVLNHPEKLQEYLIAPGTVDKLVFKDNSISEADYPYHPLVNFIIYIGNRECRVVKTKIEQWVWEQYVKVYSKENNFQVLNSLLFDDNPIAKTCKIYVPYTNHPYELRKFIYRFKVINKYHVDKFALTGDNYVTQRRFFTS